jgi:hypothetical protein
LTGKPTAPLGSVNIAEDEFDHGSGGVEERQMATILSKIDLPVGIRNGVDVQKNTPKDLETMTELLDRIPSASGGAAGVPGPWETNRDLLIAEVTAFIVAFQTINHRPTIDGVVDPKGGTLALMNKLAAEPPLLAVVAPPPGSRAEFMNVNIAVASVTSVPGVDVMRKAVVGAEYTRKLVRVDASSIKWYGVAVPSSLNPDAIPHVFFTPTPAQGNYYDPGYDVFASWGQLWGDYTSRMGGQIFAATSDQILVIPFYKNSQSQSLGDFSDNWQEVIAAVATAAINAIDPLFLRDTYTFDSIVSSSFSNGWIAHSRFNSSRGAAGMTKVLFDIDGAAAQPTSLSWRPSGTVKYLNRAVPGRQPNPVGGRDFYVGGRWGEIDKLYAPADRSKTHFMCSAHLLFHGVSMFCR